MNASIQNVTQTFLPENGNSVNVTFSTDGEWLLMAFNGGHAYCLPMLDESDMLSTFGFGDVTLTAADINALSIMADEFIAFIDTL